MEKIKEKMPSGKTIISIICIVIALVSVAITVQKFTSLDGDEDRSGAIRYKPVIVITGSMVPAIEINSISLMEYCTIDDLEVGNILMYRDDNRNINITHRVVSIEKDINGKAMYVKAKGDANSREDDLDITGDLVIGKLVKTYNWVAPYVSKIMKEPGEVNSTTVIQLLLTLVAAISLIFIFLYELIIIIIYIIMAGKNVDYFSRYIETYENSIDANKNNIEELRELTHSTGIMNRIARARAMREIKAFKNASREFNKNMKIIRYLYKKK